MRYYEARKILQYNFNGNFCYPNFSSWKIYEKAYLKEMRGNIRNYAHTKRECFLCLSLLWLLVYTIDVLELYRHSETADDDDAANK